MAALEPQFNLVVIFFIYGLAFFFMGVALILEAGRYPALADARVLLPLAIFGFVHGIHEWLEMSILVAGWFGLGIHSAIPWIRLGMLVVSFTALLVFSMQVLRPPPGRFPVKTIYVEVGLLALYVLLVIIVGLVEQSTLTHWLEDADALSRYMLAVPGAAVAALALERQARDAKSQNRQRLGFSFQLAAWGFVFYSLTQLFVSPRDLFLAPYLNQAVFLEITGIPIQAIRAVLAVAITVGLARATQIVERERREQLIAAQQTRLQAMEQREHDLIEREVLRRELLRYIVVAQEDERARIARELHDETAQFLTALTLDLATLKNSVTGNPQIDRIVNRLQKLSRQMSQGIYRMVHDLRPAQLDDLGLAAALKHLIDDESNHSGLFIDFTVDGSRVKLDPLVETVLFRVAQEALTNVSRHAGCQQSQVILSYESDLVVLHIHDDGVGFEPTVYRSDRKGWGLAGMLERVEAVGGSLRIESCPGQGTSIEAVIPLMGTEGYEDKQHEYNTLDAG
jgi:signal transduction histidine kinase